MGNQAMSSIAYRILLILAWSVIASCQQDIVGLKTCKKLQTLLSITDPTVATSSGSCTNTGVGATSYLIVKGSSVNTEVAYYLDQQSPFGSLPGNKYELE